MKEIMEVEVSGGKAIAIVDDQDYDRVNQYQWTLTTEGYAQAMIDGRIVLMHRFIIGDSVDDKVGDHINGQRLDNRRCNLRPCTQAQNMRNKRKHRNATSRFIGVIWWEPDKKWRASIGLDRKQYYIGAFEDEVEAARAYDALARKHHKEFASLNFPNEISTYDGLDPVEKPDNVPQGISWRVWLQLEPKLDEWHRANKPVTARMLAEEANRSVNTSSRHKWLAKIAAHLPDKWQLTTLPLELGQMGRPRLTLIPKTREKDDAY